ncbi:hypothetical protein DFH07DRAFT_1000246 [Mycena maculata]|uniref:Uncharacterized protein n=1 Tax=Mycena maculata TaxID=230809 RepID=A0AAD7MQ87_9AGAR|nr:hypothetical protein DFH07DRAFT_1000381 [Mycena maculata]KAJ7727143.1 hypothetical protein DFH07DRAFT_1000246 [Mycena maculata]
MVFRLPTHLDNFIPPPSTQSHSAAAGRPWRGTLTVRGMRSSDPGSNQEIRVTAVETDGESDVRRWPSQFFAQLVHGRPILREVRAWIQQHAPPISTFMPDRLPDPDANVVNMANFRSLSRMLFENSIVAIAGWGTDNFPGGGIIIIPAEHSSALLVAALFFAQFPDIITTRLNIPLTPIVTQSQPHNPYSQPMSTTPISQYASASGSRQIQSPTSFRRSHHDGSLSPVEQPISRSRQEQFRPMIPREPSMAPMHAHPAWPAVRDDQDKPYSPYPPSGEPPSLSPSVTTTHQLTRHARHKIRGGRYPYFFVIPTPSRYPNILTIFHSISGSMSTPTVSPAPDSYFDTGH